MTNINTVKIILFKNLILIKFKYFYMKILLKTSKYNSILILFSSYYFDNSIFQTRLYAIQPLKIKFLTFKILIVIITSEFCIFLE